MDNHTASTYEVIENSRKELITAKYPRRKTFPVENLGKMALKVYKKLGVLNIDILPCVWLGKDKVDIFIPGYNIAMMYVDVDDPESAEKAQRFYEYCFKHHFGYFPVYIRSNETIKFIMEKVVNTLIKRTAFLKTVSEKASKVTDCNH